MLGLGFGYFALKAHTPFTTGVCFWFSVFFLCDCFRLARVCQRLDRNRNLFLEADADGITHYVSWLEPEHRRWNEITGFRTLKSPTSETLYFQLKPRKGELFRFAFFGGPKFDLPLGCVPGGREGFLRSLEAYPAAKHLLPARTTAEAPAQAA